MYVAYPYSNIVSVVSSTLPGKVLGNITFPAGSMPRVMTYVPFNHYLYVADEGTYYLSIINSTTNKIIGRILVGNSPEALAYDYLTQKLYVANYGGGSNGTISVVDVKTNRVSTTITVGFEPQFAAFDPAHREIFIGMPSEQYVTVISDMTNKIVKNIMINAGNTTGVAYNPVNHRMYVTEPFLNNEVLVIDGKTNTVVGNVTVGKFPSSVAFDPKNNETYVTNQFSNSVSLISSTSNTVVDTVPLASLPPPYLSPSALAYDASNGFMYVANTGFNTLSLVSSLKN
jgi:YVTN family beta-propeller protein